MPSSKRLDATWPILGLIAFCLLAVVGTFLVMAWRGAGSSAPRQVAPVDLREMHRTWLEEVASQTGRLDADSDAQHVRSVIDALLALRVTADDRDAHLKLITELLAMERGESGAWQAIQATVADLRSR